MSAAPDIFLSYNREDAAVAKTYAVAFAAAGLEVWWDATLRSGEAYDEVTEAALRGAKSVVVLWSKKSAVSRWVRAEASIAEENGTLVPAKIEFCDLPVMFRLTQTAELSHWRGEADDSAWQAFLSDVRQMVGREAPVPVPATPAAAPVTVAADMSLVAVLPFTHRGSDEELEFLADDLTEDVTQELARSRLFKVIAAGTMAEWRGKAVDYRGLGRELKARYLAEGKLQRAGETVRLTVQLTDTESASTLWSTRIVRNSADIAAAPEEFPVAVAAQLGEQIMQSDQTFAMAKQGPLSGWDHVLRAYALWDRGGSDTARRAYEEARKAVAAAPDLGLANALLAATLAGLKNYEPEKFDETRRREMQEHIKRAMELDRDNPAILRITAGVYYSLDDMEAHLRLARRAVEINPNSLEAQHMFGFALYATGHTAEAIALIGKLDRLAPHDKHRPMSLQILGLCLCLEGEPAKAEAALDRSLALNPSYGVALKWKAIAQAQRGREVEAKATIGQLREAEPGMTLEQHVHPTVTNPHLRERGAESMATLRRLWDATGGDG